MKRSSTAAVALCVCVSKTSIYISISMRDRFINTNELSRHRRLLERQNTQINRWIGRLHFKIKRKKQHSNWNDNRFFFRFVVNSFVWKWYLNSFIHSQYWCRAVTTLRGACIKQRSFYLQNDSTDIFLPMMRFLLYIFRLKPLIMCWRDLFFFL